MNDTIKTSTILIGGSDGSTMYILCEMIDGSSWTCDLNGKNWQQVKPTLQELSKSFNGR